MAHFGARAFEKIGGEVVQTTSFIRRNSLIKNYIGTYSRLIAYTTQYEKEKAFLCKNDIYKAKQCGFYEIPGNPIAYWISEKTLKAFENKQLLKNVVSASVGIQKDDNDKFLHFW